MSPRSSSAERVQYDLRPAKQVERRMIIDALQRLTVAGFDIPSYEYTGFGSIYFVDFILFHKFLGLTRMTSLEHDETLSSRINFNKPFGDFVSLRISSAAEVIPTLSRDKSHFLWLDYDTVLNAEHISDVLAAMAYLSVGSVILVTLDTEPPRITKADYIAAGRNLPNSWRAYFEREAADFLPASLDQTTYAKSKLYRISIEVLDRVFRRGLAGRTDVEFSPLFNFIYKDGSSRMLTIGGMITNAEHRRKLQASTLGDAKYIRRSLDAEPYAIEVPKLTRKERLYLDCYMPCDDSWRPTEVDLPDKLVKQYRDIYRFFPAYAELLL